MWGTPGMRRPPCGPCPFPSSGNNEKEKEEQVEEEHIFFSFVLPSSHQICSYHHRLIPSIFVSSSYSITHHAGLMFAD